MLTRNIGRWIVPMGLLAFVGAFVFGQRSVGAYRSEIAEKLATIAARVPPSHEAIETQRAVIESDAGVVLLLSYSNIATREEVLAHYENVLLTAGWEPLFGRQNAYRSKASCLLIHAEPENVKLEFVWMTEACRLIYNPDEYRPFVRLFGTALIGIGMAAIVFLVPWQAYRAGVHPTARMPGSSTTDRDKWLSSDPSQTVQLVVMTMLAGGSLLALFVAIFGVLVNVKLLNSVG